MANLNRIKYKTFTFPNNPETTSFKCDRSYIKHKYPNLVGNELEDFGANAIVITGSGCFFGANAYNDFNKLYKVFKKKSVGDFYHPIYTQVTRGLMVSLEGTVDPEVNVIKYSFELVADTKPNVKENRKKYAVKKVKKKSSKKTSSSSGSNSNSSSSSKSYNVGDVVTFNGGMCYKSSYSNATGYNATAGKAKITLGPNSKGNGGAHPWHLVHTDSKSNVYGWVNKGTFK